MIRINDYAKVKQVYSSPLFYSKRLCATIFARTIKKPLLRAVSFFLFLRKEGDSNP